MSEPNASPALASEEYVAALVRAILEMERPTPDKTSIDEVSLQLLHQVISTAGMDPRKVNNSKVAASTPTHRLASSIAQGVKNGESIFLRCMGPESVNQAVKALATAHAYSPRLFLGRPFWQGSLGTRHQEPVSEVTIQVVPV